MKKFCLLEFKMCDRIKLIAFLEKFHCLICALILTLCRMLLGASPQKDSRWSIFEIGRPKIAECSLDLPAELCLRNHHLYSLFGVHLCLLTTIMIEFWNKLKTGFWKLNCNNTFLDENKSSFTRTGVSWIKIYYNGNILSKILPL